MKLRIKDQESILNIDRSVLYDVYKRLHLPNGSYEPVSPIQSHQEYIKLPNFTEGYIREIYEDSVSGNFAAESKYEPYEPQFMEFVRTLIQKAPMIQSLVEQTPELNYSPEVDKFIFELFLEASKLRRLEEQGFNNTAKDAEPVDESDLSSLAERIMPENISDMPNMPEPDTEPMEEQNPMMNLEMIIQRGMSEAVPDQMPKTPEMEQMQEQEPEQQMTLEMLISLLLGG